MSPDEVMAMLVCGAIAAFGWSRWYWRTAMATTLGSTHSVRLPVYMTPLVCAVLLYLILRHFASEDVRDSAVYLAFYEIMGAAWLMLSVAILPVLGISVRDDAVERRNPAAVYATTGGMLGFTLCFAGANIGDGPGWWVVVFCGALASCALLGLWALIEVWTDLADSVTVERDEATGLRIGAFLLAAGAILGRSVAGNWTSAAAAVSDFASLAWLALPLTATALILERLLEPNQSRRGLSSLTYGVLPAVAFVAYAALALWGIGWW